MRTKAEYYSMMNQQKNLHQAVPSFTPAINKSKKQESEPPGTKRWEAIIEKGKEYKLRREELAQMRNEEKDLDPELTFKPKINAPRAKKGDQSTATDAE